jgi:hypothetical protein
MDDTSGCNECNCVVVLVRVLVVVNSAAAAADENDAVVTAVGLGDVNNDHFLLEFFNDVHGSVQADTTTTMCEGNVLCTNTNTHPTTIRTQARKLHFAVRYRPVVGT